MASPPLRIGILGAAKIAPTAVIEPARGRTDVQVTAVAARDPARARAYAEAQAIPAVAEDYAALIRRDDVDLVYVALPIASHAVWTIRALEAGKAVLCEKSFAMDAAEARAMVAASDQHGLPLIEAFHYRYHRVIRRAEQIVGSGELGRLVRAEARFDVGIPYDANEIRWRADQGGGALGDLGCYPLHSLRTLIGSEPQVLEARVRRQHGVDAETWARLRFPVGLDAELSCSMTAERPAARLVIEGEQGRLEILNYLAPQMGCRFTVTIGGVMRAEPSEGPTSYEAQLDHVVEVMAGGARALTGGADAVAMMAAMDAIRAAA